MKYAIYAGFGEKLRTLGPEGAAAYAADLGFQAAELFEMADPAFSRTVGSREDAARVRRALESCGLSVCCFSAYADLWNCREAEQLLMTHAELACEAGSPFLHHTLLPWLEQSPELPAFPEAVERAVDAAARVANYAAKLGLTCIYEDQGLYLNGVENFGFFLREMKNRCGNIGVCGDVGNIFFADERPEDFFRAFRKDILHVHLKDYLKKDTVLAPGKGWLPTKGGAWLRDTVIGDGAADLEACMTVLKEAGYSGVLSLENGHPEPFEAGVRQAMEIADRCFA